MFFWEVPPQRPPGDGSGEYLLWVCVCALHTHTHARTHKHFLTGMHLYSIVTGLHNILFGFFYLLEGVSLYCVSGLIAC